MSVARLIKFLLALLGLVQLGCVARLFVFRPQLQEAGTLLLALSRYSFAGLIAAVMMLAVALVGMRSFRSKYVVFALCVLDLLVWLGLFALTSVAA